MQETTTLVQSIEASDNANVIDSSSTELTDSSFDETLTISHKFDRIFKDYNTSYIEFKTDNLSIFGTSNTIGTLNWNIFEESTVVTTDGIRNKNNLQHLLTTTDKIDSENVNNDDIKMSNTETTEFFSGSIDSFSTTEFTWNFNEFEKSTTNVGNSEYTTRATDDLNMGALILKIIEELKKPDIVGIPGVDIPDPTPIPDMKQSITMFDTLYFTNSAVQGMSTLRILYINVDVEALEVRKLLYLS